MAGAQQQDGQRHDAEALSEACEHEREDAAVQVRASARTASRKPCQATAATSMVRAGRALSRRLTVIEPSKAPKANDGNQVAEGGLVEPIDLPHDVRQQSVGEGKGREVDQEHEQDRGQQLRRGPYMGNDLRAGRATPTGAQGRVDAVGLDHCAACWECPRSEATPRHRSTPPRRRQGRCRTARTRLAPVSAPATRAESEVVREMPMAAVSRSAGMVSATSATRTPRSEGRTMPIRPVMTSTEMGLKWPANAMAMRVAASDDVAGAHAAQHVAMADPVASHAEDRRHQRAGKQQRAEHGQHQHRTCLDQHVPAEDQRLHLEGARGEQVGRPLEAEAANPERGQAGSRSSGLDLGRLNAVVPFVPRALEQRFTPRVFFVLCASS